jgi:integrase
MATFRTLPSGKINAQVRRNGHPPISATFATRTRAEAWARKIETDVDEGKHFGVARVKTLAALIDHFNANGKRIAAQADRERALRWWKREYGTRKLAAIKGDVIAEATRKLAAENIGAPDAPRTRSEQTVRHYLVALSAAFTYALGIDWIGVHPLRGRKLPPVSPGRIRWLEPDERARLLAACDASGNPDLGLVVRLALCSGARYSEIVTLRWSMIDLARECAFLGKTKNGEQRVMPIVGDALAMLKSRPRGIGRALLFPPPDDPAKVRNFWQAWDVARRRAALPGFRFHDLRHDAATQMLRAGVDSRVVATVGGWKSQAMMARYAHVVPDVIVAAAKRAQK